MSFKAVIFDLDGTLLNTLEDLADSMNVILGQEGFPVHETDDYKYIVGWGMYNLVKNALPEEAKHDHDLIERLLPMMLEQYQKRWDRTTVPYEGINSMLSSLAGRNIPINILSNKPHEFTLLSVSKLLPDHDFDTVLGVREGHEPKPDPAGALEIAEKLSLSPSEIVFVGDSCTDMETAVNAGMYPVGVLWGFRDEKELKENGAQKILASPSELISLF